MRSKAVANLENVHGICRVLLATDGTVTDIVEAFVAEAVRLDLLKQEVLGAAPLPKV